MIRRPRQPRLRIEQFLVREVPWPEPITRMMPILQVDRRLLAASVVQFQFRKRNAILETATRHRQQQVQPLPGPVHRNVAYISAHHAHEPRARPGKFHHTIHLERDAMDDLTPLRHQPSGTNMVELRLAEKWLEIHRMHLPSICSLQKQHQAHENPPHNSSILADKPRLVTTDLTVPSPPSVVPIPSFFEKLSTGIL